MPMRGRRFAVNPRPTIVTVTHHAGRVIDVLLIDGYKRSIALRARIFGDGVRAVKICPLACMDSCRNSPGVDRFGLYTRGTLVVSCCSAAG